MDTSAPRAFVLNSGCGAGGNISVIDTNDPKEVARIPITGLADDMVLNPSTDSLYVSVQGCCDASTPGVVNVIDAETGQVADAILVGKDPGGIAVNPITNRIYVSNYSDHSVSVIDGEFGEVVATIDLVPGQRSFPDAIAVNARTNRIYVECDYSENYSVWTDICVIDGANNTVIARIRTRGGFQYMAVDEQRNLLYAADFGWSSVRRIDGATNQIIGEVKTAGRPHGITYNSNTDRIYVSTEGPSGSELAGRVVTIDAATFSKIEETVVGGALLGIGTYAPNYRIFVVENFSAKVMVLTEDAIAPVSTLNLQNGAILATGQTITGSVTDDFTGVAKVLVTFSQSTLQVPFSQGPLQFQVEASTTCSSDRRSCTWSAFVPTHPGPYIVSVQGIDRAGSKETMSPTLSEQCVDNLLIYGCVGEKDPGPYAVVTVV